MKIAAWKKRKQERRKLQEKLQTQILNLTKNTEGSFDSILILVALHAVNQLRSERAAKVSATEILGLAATLEAVYKEITAFSRASEERQWLLGTFVEGLLSHVNSSFQKQLVAAEITNPKVFFRAARSTSEVNQ